MPVGHPERLNIQAMLERRSLWHGETGLTSVLPYFDDQNSMDVRIGMSAVPLNPIGRTELISSVPFLADDAVCVDAIMADLKMLPTLLEI